MSKVALGIIIGVLGLCCLLSLCCAGLIVYLSGDPSFRESYCEGYYSEAKSYKDEPTGWCK